jgi:hypothetical protein
MILGISENQKVLTRSRNGDDLMESCGKGGEGQNLTSAQKMKVRVEVIYNFIYNCESSVVASKLLSNSSVNTFPGNGYVLNNRRIVGSGVFFVVCSEAT